MRNFGQHNAIMCGLRHARGEFIITMDDDGQHPPEEIPKLLKAVEETGADVVYGVPKNRNHAPWRNLGSWIVVTFYKLVLKIKVTPGAFRIVRRQVVDAILSCDLNYTYIDGLLPWNTDRIAQIEVEHRPRKEGRLGVQLWQTVYVGNEAVYQFFACAAAGGVGDGLYGCRGWLSPWLLLFAATTPRGNCRTWMGVAYGGCLGSRRLADALSWHYRRILRLHPPQHQQAPGVYHPGGSGPL